MEAFEGFLEALSQEGLNQVNLYKSGICSSAFK